MSPQTHQYSNIRKSHNESGLLLFYGLLAYTVMFFIQLAGRIKMLEPLRIEFLLGFILIVCAGLRIIKGEVRLSEDRVSTAAFCLLGVMFITIPFAYVKMRALLTFIQVIKIFAIYLMIVAAIDSEKKLKVLIVVFVAANTLVIVEPFLLSLTGRGFIYNNHMMRLAGTTSMFGHPNALGMQTASSLPFFYYFMRDAKSTSVRVLCFLLMAISVRVIMLTQSRTAFVGFLVFAAIVFVSAKRKALAMIGVVCCLATVWMVVPEQTKNRFSTLYESFRIMSTDRDSLSEEEVISFGSMNSRWELIRRAFIAFTENPIIGLGLNCFASYNGRTWGLWFPPHNTYLQVMAETGLAGTAALLMLILSTLKSFRQARRLAVAQGLERTSISTIISAFTVYYVIWLVTSFFGIELYNNFWWVTAAISVVILRILRIKDGAQQPQVTTGTVPFNRHNQFAGVSHSHST